MSGVVVIGALLAANAPVVAKVADRMKAGDLPAKTALPALAVNSISVVERQTLKVGATVRVRERVRVTIAAASVADRLAVWKLARSACRGQFAALGGVTAISVLTDVAGPEMRSEDSSVYSRTQDFVVSFEEAA